MKGEDDASLDLSGEEVQENVLLETQEGEDAHLHPYKSVEDYKKDMKLRGLLFALELGALGKGSRDLAVISRKNPAFKAKLESMHLRAKLALDHAGQAATHERARLVLADQAIAIGVDAAEAGTASNDRTVAARLRAASQYISQCLIELHDASKVAKAALVETGTEAEAEAEVKGKAKAKAAGKGILDLLPKQIPGAVVAALSDAAKEAMFATQAMLENNMGSDQLPKAQWDTPVGAWNRPNTLAVGAGVVNYGGDPVMEREFGPTNVRFVMPRPEYPPVHFPMATQREEKTDESLLNDQTERLTDCVGCIYVVGAMELLVGAVKNQDMMFQAFKSTCAEVETAQIFFMACQQMNDKLDDFIVDYKGGLTASESCEKNRLCRDP